MKGGEVFIPKTINAINIYDLASTVSKTFNNSKNIKITGLRGGEKIHERILTDQELVKLKTYKNLS